MKNKIIKNSILVVHGPNINLFGVRNVAVYGKETFSLINRQITAIAKKMS